MSGKRVENVAALRALNNPLRLRLYYALCMSGSATATHLADELDESVSLVSYHLRRLAAFDYVEPDPDPPGGDARERWWRPTSEGFSFSPSDFDEGPDAAAALTQAMRQMTAHRMAYWQAWVDGQAGWSRQWRDAAFSGDNPLLEMTPEQVHEFTEDYLELVRGWSERLATAPEDPEREHVMLSMQAFPFRP